MHVSKPPRAVAPTLAFVTPPGVPGWQRWLVFSPLARIVFFAVVLTALSMAGHAVVASLGWLGSSAEGLHRALAMFAVEVLPALLAYLALVKGIERRRVRELAWREAPTRGVAGLMGGFVLFSAVIGVLWLAGSYRVLGFNPHPDWLPQLLMVGIGAGVAEEIIARGVIFRIVEEGLGTWIALLLSALLFGAAHLGNPHATLWSALAIAIEAGLMFGLLYRLTGSLWPCMGLHAAWNFAQGAVYGVPVSGTHADGFLVSARGGPDWLSGGAFGAEASVIALLLCCLVSALLLAAVLKRRGIVPPAWRRRATLAQ